MSEQKIYAIGEDFTKQLMTYLVSRPYFEVEMFVEGFKNILTIDEYQEAIKKKSE